MIGNVLGFGIAKFGGKGTLDWMKPADKASEAYKAKELSKAGSSKTIVKIAEIDEEEDLNDVDEVSSAIKDLMA